MDALKSLPEWSARRVALTFLAVALGGIYLAWKGYQALHGWFVPGARKPRILAPIVAMVEVDSAGYSIPLYTNKIPGVFIRHGNGIGNDLLKYPPVPLWVGAEVARQLADIPFDASNFTDCRGLDPGRLENFAMEGKKTIFELEKLGVGSGANFSPNSVLLGVGSSFSPEYSAFDMRLDNPTMVHEDHRFIGGDSPIPNQVVREVSFSLQGTAKFRYRGRPLVEQEWHEIGLLEAYSKCWVIYRGDYVVFWDYPYFERKGWFGKPTYRFYVVKVPKDDPTWFDKEWLRQELFRLPARINKEYNNLETDSDGSPTWKKTTRYFERLKQLDQEGRAPESVPVGAKESK